MNRNSISVLVGLEARQRIRSTRWKITAIILFVLISILILGSLYLGVAVGGATYRQWAENLLDITIAVVLFLGFAAAPTLSATSINGDRRDATLALVQATPISSWDLAIGKLLGSWFASLALIGVALPYLIWGIASSHTSILFGIIAVVVIALIMLAYCAIGLAFSTLTARPAASAMLTQATVLLLLLGLPIAFGLTYPLTERTHTVKVTEHEYNDSWDSSTCTLVDKDVEYNHTEYTWWLLTPNPLLIVSDTLSAGVDHEEAGDVYGGADLFAFLLSSARSGPHIADQSCAALNRRYADYYPADSPLVDDVVLLESDDPRLAQHVGDSWYYGLIVTIAIGTGSLLVAVRRLRVPARKLGKGVRVA